MPISISQKQSPPNHDHPVATSVVPIDPYPAERKPPVVPVLPQKPGPQITPGARPPRLGWLILSPYAVFLGWLAAVFLSIDLPRWPTIATFITATGLSALVCLPREVSPGRQRLPILVVLVLPWIVSIIADLPQNALAFANWMLPFQISLLAASALLPLILLPLMQGARRFTAVLGFFNFVVTFLLVLTSILLLYPDS